MLKAKLENRIRKAPPALPPKPLALPSRAPSAAPAKPLALPSRANVNRRNIVNNSQLLKPSSQGNRNMLRNKLGNMKPKTNNTKPKNASKSNLSKLRANINTSPLLKPKQNKVKIEKIFGNVLLKQKNISNKPVNVLNNLNAQFRKENEARKRLQALNDEKFNLLRQKARLQRDRKTIMTEKNALLKEKNNFIRNQNVKTRQNAASRFNSRLANLNSKVTDMKANSNINKRLREIQNASTRSNNKKLLQKSYYGYGPKKPTVTNRLKSMFTFQGKKA